MRARFVLGCAVTALAMSACSDATSSSGDIALLPAFETVPLAFSANSSSFDESGDAGIPFSPEAMGAASGGGGGRGRGMHGTGGATPDGFGMGGRRGMLMGGGLGRDFIGALAFGRGMGRGPFGHFELRDDCTFDAGTGRVTCATRERHGVSVDVSFAFTDADGQAQAAYDTGTTNIVNVRTTVAGTKTRHDGQITSTVSHTSDRTVSGLASGSTERTVNGVAEANEATTGTKDGVAFSAVREAADTTTGLVIPLVDGRPTIPSAGTVIRRMQVTITRGTDSRSHFRREQVTFTGTNVVNVQITQDDVTKSCTITLPSRRLVCE